MFNKSPTKFSFQFFCQRKTLKKAAVVLLGIFFVAELHRPPPLRCLIAFGSKDPIVVHCASFNNARYLLPAFAFSRDAIVSVSKPNITSTT